MAWGGGGKLLDAEDVDDEDEVALGVALAFVTVGEVLGDDQQDAGADGLAGQALGPALDDAGEREAGLLAAVEAGVEDLCRSVRVTPT